MTCQIVNIPEYMGIEEYRFYCKKAKKNVLVTWPCVSQVPSSRTKDTSFCVVIKEYMNITSNIFNRFASYKNS